MMPRWLDRLLTRRCPSAPPHARLGDIRVCDLAQQDGYDRACERVKARCWAQDALADDDALAREAYVAWLREVGG
jgi:hypothetical protein